MSQILQKLFWVQIPAPPPSSLVASNEMKRYNFFFKVRPANAEPFEGWRYVYAKNITQALKMAEDRLKELYEDFEIYKIKQVY